MKLLRGLLWIVTLASASKTLACSDESETPPNQTTLPSDPLTLTAADPNVIDPLGGSRLRLSGSGFAASESHPAVNGASIGGVLTAAQVVSDTEIVVYTPPLASAGQIDLTVHRGEESATLPGELIAWSPVEITGARVFDAASGVAPGPADTQFEWQRLTPQIHSNWRARDGNTLTWLPSTGKFWMVAGWNPYDDPAWPAAITTDEVWSTNDGITWQPELAHGHGAFERRHAHNTVVWNNQLWMVGGDTWQGYYNHDVVSSADGVHWTQVLPPGSPPWTPRALSMLGVHNGRLWMAGGQDLLGDPNEYTFHNDVWVTDDGSNWTQVVADSPPSDTRWGGCGMVDSLVSFKGELWMLGCARYNETAGHQLIAEVWSSADGKIWKQHATPPWAGKGWPNVVVWRNELWILFGYTYGNPSEGWPAGNSNEVWHSPDGETWTALPVDSPVPGSHAQGVGVHPDYLLYAGGNYTFGIGAGEDRSAWRLIPFDGQRACAWSERGEAGLTVAALNTACPLRVPNAFGEQAAGLHFDGSTQELSLPESAVDEAPNGRSVFWVARAPYIPLPYLNYEDTYAPVASVVGGPTAGGMPNASVGYTNGTLVLRNLNDALGENGEFVYSRFAAGSDLQSGQGEVRLVGYTHATNRTVQAWIDGALVDTGEADYGTPRAWSTLGGSLTGDYYGPYSRFAGTLGAVVIVPEVLDSQTIALLHAWARGRFGALPW
ncbi:MAG: IPT/TIG domain-containing protein [Polyangiaceae bacterium]|nr:IPT/TIG domain-containing protein [Polyangiaceae bacterium]